MQSCGLKCRTVSKVTISVQFHLIEQRDSLTLYHMESNVPYVFKCFVIVLLVF